MKSWRSWLAILGITAALDLMVAAFIPAETFDIWVKGIPIGKPALVLTPRLNHDLVPNLDVVRAWGAARYHLRTNSFGLRTGTCANDGRERAPKGEVFVIGDSFAEGMGLDFEKTFAGMIACQARGAGRVAYDLGVRSYSPIIYHRKIADVAQRLGITPREIVVFLDISDIQDDAEIYEERDGAVLFRADRPPMGLRYDVVDRAEWWAGRTPDSAEFGAHEGAGRGAFIRRNSMLGALAMRLYDAAREMIEPPRAPASQLNLRRSMWTVDTRLMKEFGERGLATAAANLGKLLELSRHWGAALTLVVYPWPDQVAHDDRDSIQIRYWRQWSMAHGVNFIDAFGPFFRYPKDQALRELYIPGDVHFSELGNRLAFEAWWKATCGRWAAPCEGDRRAGLVSAVDPPAPR